MKQLQNQAEQEPEASSQPASICSTWYCYAGCLEERIIDNHIQLWKLREKDKIGNMNKLMQYCQSSIVD